MTPILKMLAVVAMAIIPGGLLFLSAFILARLVATRVRAEQGPHRLKRAFATLSIRDLWNETRRSL